VNNATYEAMICKIAAAAAAAAVVVVVSYHIIQYVTVSAFVHRASK